MANSSRHSGQRSRCSRTSRNASPACSVEVASPDIGAFERGATSGVLRSASFEFETRLAVNYAFDADASVNFARGTIALTNLITGQPVAGTIGALIWNPAGTQASVVLTHLLRDGRYRATVGVTQTDFHVLPGDAKRDQTVGFDDLIVLAQNYDTTGKTFSQGNFNYDTDGAVNFDDLLILAQSYGLSLFAADPVPTAKVKARCGRREILA